MGTEFSEDMLMVLLESSKTPFIKIEAFVEKDVPVLSSKFLGKPYWPKSYPYPVDINGQPLTLLAQINFSETPKLKDYPEDGILQFFISPTHDVYGVNFDDWFDQSFFRVMYHEKVDEKEIESNLPTFDYKDEDWYAPITAEHKLTFSLGEEYVSAEDYRFKEFFGSNFYEFMEQHPNEKLWNRFHEIASSIGHKIGGYAYFTQRDPRENNYKDYVLLLQIDSIGEEICWGDSGVAGLFISKENLKNKDFSRILYTWDCS